MSKPRIKRSDHDEAWQKERMRLEQAAIVAMQAMGSRTRIEVRFSEHEGPSMWKRVFHGRNPGPLFSQECIATGAEARALNDAAGRLQAQWMLSRKAAVALVVYPYIVLGG